MGTCREAGMSEATTWLTELPVDLDSQRRLVERLLGWCERDDDVRWLVVGCSFARGEADALSDLDTAMGIQDERFEEGLGRVRIAMAGFGDLLECFDHDLGLCAPHRRVFAQYGDRTQLDLVVVRASDSTLPRVVVLYDPTHLVRAADDQAPMAQPDDVRTWACLAWSALGDLGKYVRRSSPWEALDRLEHARGHFFRVWAAAEHIPDAQYGLSAILDTKGARMPPGIEETLAGTGLAELLAAGSSLVDLLAELGPRLDSYGPEVWPGALASYVAADLAEVADDHLGPRSTP